MLIQTEVQPYLTLPNKATYEEEEKGGKRGMERFSGTRDGEEREEKRVAQSNEKEGNRGRGSRKEGRKERRLTRSQASPAKVN